MSSASVDIQSPDVRIGGNPLPASVDHLLERVVVDDHLRLPAMFELTLRDPHDAQLASGVLAEIGVKLGAAVTVSLKYEGGTEELVTGEVTSLEADLDASGSHVVIRGYDKSHRLHRGRKARSWADQKDSEIAATIAGEAGLGSSVDDSEVAHAYIAQPGISDWEFLASRAREIGFDLRVSGGSLEFKKPSSASDGPEQGSLGGASTSGQVVYGKNLVAFRTRVSIVDQASSFEVRGWDVKAKKAVIGTAQAATTSASSVSRSRRQRKRSETSRTSGTTGSSRPRTGPRRPQRVWLRASAPPSAKRRESSSATRSSRPAARSPCLESDHRSTASTPSPRPGMCSTASVTAHTSRSAAARTAP